DKDIRDLTNGYACVQQNQRGDYVWDTAVTVKDYKVTENADGGKTYTVTINEGLKYSDGSAITAKDYIVYTLIMASPVCLDADVTAQGGSSYVGYTAYAAATTPTPFSGIRLIDEYTFSYTMIGDYFPYYYENTYATFAPYSLKLWLGDDVDVKDDGQGAYLTEKWYEKTTDANGTEVYKKAEQITKARYATTERPCSGPYKFVKYDQGEKTVSLTINEYYQGNFEGQKPHIKDISYILVISKTQIDLFKSGGVDILFALSEGDEINAALEAVRQDPDKYAYTNYLRSGYGKLQLICDYGPTQFVKVRQAISHLLDKNSFASTFTGGYGSTVKGPYGLASTIYQQTKDELEAKLKAYEFSVDEAMELLEADGWVYNADGSAYSGSGVRYKKLTADEAAINGNDTYQCGNTTYKTVKVGDYYYMPLAINWCSSEDNPVSELLVTMLQTATTTTQAGVVVEQDIVDFTTLLHSLYRDGEHATPKYSMFNLATGFTPVYDYAGYWMTKYSYSNLVYAGVTPCEGATYTEADASKYSEDENAMIDAVWRMYMGMGNSSWLADKELDELTWDMVYTATNEEEFAEYFVDYIVRWNELLPEIALYSNLYHDVYSAKIGGYQVNPDWGVANAIVYCYDKTAQ
ncbi:MAG: hypothetical protein IJX62_08760, partial [Clostridia bacterium]|nr:hypothetical protein [Clostridia bacterium]